MKKLKVFSISAILIVICCSFLFSASVSAASKKRNKFDHKPSGNIYYYDENGHTREFDSWISEKVPAGRIKPAFFVSNFKFLSIVFYCNVL